MKLNNLFVKTVRQSMVIFSFVFAVFLLNAQAQTVLVNYDFASAVAGTPCTASPLTTATGVTSTFTTGGTGGGTCTTPAGTAATAPPAFVANAANQSVSLTSFAAGSTNFFQFQLSGVGSFQDYMLFFQSQRSGTGPVNLDVQYSTDGMTFTTFQTVNPGNGVFAAFNIDLSAVTAIENQPTVYFRLVGSGGTGAAGTLRLDNFQVAATGVSAATVSVGGRVTNASGYGIGGVTLSIDGGSLSEPIFARTSPFGYYTFEGIPAGQVYVITVSSKSYTFNPPSRAITVQDSVSDADFVAQQ
ncbi:MAG TPA: carboxypeptidase-like regulatory domain-containing protein [Pyrinomonadaceae bacterium]|nr:carboxypeptidase-like regulatory domain-containing protein [Pyrinomonadaceae bacterium]